MLIGIATIASGCAGVTPSIPLEEQLIVDGYKKLYSQEIKTTLGGNTLQGKTSKSSITIFLSTDGSIRGKAILNSGGISRDQGTWKTSHEGYFCDTWDNWRTSDCDYVFVRDKEFIMLNLDGTKSSEGKIEAGNSRGL